MAAISKTVLITGASSGIGEATALRLVKAGWRVVATARRPEALAALSAAGCAVAELDLAHEARMADAVARIVRENGPIGVLVNNAGYSQSGVLETLPLEKVRAQFEANVFGLLRLTQLLLPAMRAQRWGKIVNISSMGGKIQLPGGGAYHASKHALEALSDVLRFEVGGFGIDVVVIEPGLVRTRFADSAVATMTPPEGPYAKLEAEVVRRTRDGAVKGLFSLFAGPPESVAAVIEKAITARRPKPRYRVTMAAHLFMLGRRWFGDRGWDFMLRIFYPQPR